MKSNDFLNANFTYNNYICKRRIKQLTVLFSCAPESSSSQFLHQSTASSPICVYYHQQFTASENDCKIHKRSMSLCVFKWVYMFIIIYVYMLQLYTTKAHVNIIWYVNAMLLHDACLSPTRYMYLTRRIASMNYMFAYAMHMMHMMSWIYATFAIREKWPLFCAAARIKLLSVYSVYSNTRLVIKHFVWPKIYTFNAFN